MIYDRYHWIQSFVVVVVVVVWWNVVANNQCWLLLIILHLIFLLSLDIYKCVVPTNTQQTTTWQMLSREFAFFSLRFASLLGVFFLHKIYFIYRHLHHHHHHHSFFIVTNQRTKTNGWWWFWSSAMMIGRSVCRSVIMDIAHTFFSIRMNMNQERERDVCHDFAWW